MRRYKYALPFMHESDDGEFVFYAEAIKEIEQLRSALSFYNNQCPKCSSTLGLLDVSECPLCAARTTNRELHAEIERLHAELAEAYYWIGD